MIQKPEQLISSSERTPEWYADNGRYWMEHISIINTELMELREAKACGEIKEMDYKFVTNPYGDLIQNEKQLPAKLKNIDIIKPIVNQLIGEFLKQNIEPLVFNKNSDIHSAKKDMKNKMVVEATNQEFLNILIGLGLYVPGQTDEQGQPIQPPMSPEKIEEAISNVVDEHAINGQYKLDYIYNTKNIKDVLKEVFYFYATTGLGLVYRDIINDDIVYKHKRPIDFGYVKQHDTKYIEDSIAVKALYKVQYSDLAVMFQGNEEFEKIKDEIKIRVDNYTKGFSFEKAWQQNFYRNRHIANNNEGELRREQCILTHIQWKSSAKIYRKYIQEPDGTTTFIDLDDRYIPSPDDVIEERVCRESHEVYCINGQHFVGGQVLQHSRADFNNPNESKFSYNGVFIQSYLENVRTIIDGLDPYQEAYNIVKYLIQKKINKNKGKIATIPLSLLNGFKDNSVKAQINEEGVMESITMETNSPIGESLYFADATEFLFIDDADLDPQQAQVAATLLKSIDLSLANEIEYLYNYADRIKEDAYEYVGFNRFRRGNAEQRDAVYNARQGEATGSLMTQELFEDFRLFTEKEFGCILDMCNFLYKDGLKGQYFNSDYEEHNIDIPPVGLSNANLGIVVRSGGKDKENFEYIKQNIQAMTQNGYTPYMLATLLSKSSNFDKMRKELKKLEDENNQRTQQAQESLNQIERDKLQLERDRLALDREKVNGELQIKAFVAGMTSQDKTNPLDMIKLMNDNNKNDFDNLFKLGQLKQGALDAKVEMYKADKTLEVARENKGV